MVSESLLWTARVSSAVLWGTRISVANGLYGFTRGFRAEDSNNRLFGRRCAAGIVNGFFYALPVWNVINLFRLANRVEIHMRGWNPVNHPNEYLEFTGYCNAVL